MGFKGIVIEVVRVCSSGARRSGNHDTRHACRRGDCTSERNCGRPSPSTDRTACHCARRPIHRRCTVKVGERLRPIEDHPARATGCRGSHRAARGRPPVRPLLELLPKRVGRRLPPGTHLRQPELVAHEIDRTQPRAGRRRSRRGAVPTHRRNPGKEPGARQIRLALAPALHGCPASFRRIADSPRRPFGAGGQPPHRHPRGETEPCDYRHPPDDGDPRGPSEAMKKGVEGLTQAPRAALELRADEILGTVAAERRRTCGNQQKQPKEEDQRAHEPVGPSTRDIENGGDGHDKQGDGHDERHIAEGETQAGCRAPPEHAPGAAGQQDNEQEHGDSQQYEGDHLPPVARRRLGLAALRGAFALGLPRGRGRRRYGVRAGGRCRLRRRRRPGTALDRGLSRLLTVGPCPCHRLSPGLDVDDHREYHRPPPGFLMQELLDHVVDSGLDHGDV